MKRLKLTIAAFAVAMLGMFALAPAATVGAIDPLASACTGTNANSEICTSRANDDASSLIGTIVNVLLFLVGGLSVVMIVVAGVMYTTSTGDSGRVSKAKNTLTYAIVGLLVSLFAYAIVNWVLGRF